MSNEELDSRLSQVKAQYEIYKSRPFEINISRGIPSTAQLNVANNLLDKMDSGDWLGEDDLDIRSYGGLLGLVEARELFSELLDTKVEETLIGGNASLQLMYIVLNILMYTSGNPWYKQGEVKFICPSPGYDRHWNMLEYLGIEMIQVDLTGDGPDMDTVEKLVSEDDTIKGIFCVPKYSNPTGDVYSDETIDRLANMKTAYDDFRIIFDNAYAVHHLTEDKIEIKNILEACKGAGVPERPIIFTSTSKITLPGSGVSAIGASEKNILFIASHLNNQIISFDKVNQKRHVKYLQNKENILKIMEEHAEILGPKFEWIQAIFQAYFSGNRNKMAEWTDPKGGYFVHITTKDGCASDVVSLMNDIGIILTPANAAYPYQKNEKDNSIRLAPSYADINKLEVALEALCICIELVTLEKYGEEILHEENE